MLIGSLGEARSPARTDTPLLGLDVALSDARASLAVSADVLAAALVIALVYSWAAEYLGAVAAITGAYIAGVLVAQTEFKKAVDVGIHPLNPRVVLIHARLDRAERAVRFRVDPDRRWCRPGGRLAGAYRRLPRGAGHNLPAPLQALDAGRRFL